VSSQYIYGDGWGGQESGGGWAGTDGGDVWEAEDKGRKDMHDASA